MALDKCETMLYTDPKVTSGASTMNSPAKCILVLSNLLLAVIIGEEP